MPMSMPAAETRIATCPLCEATCGLEITMDGGRPTKVRGDAADPFSRGYVCPKALAIPELQTDPDRIRTPRVRRGSTWSEVSWDDAFAEIATRLGPIPEQHGRDAVAVYLGNPSVHNLDLQLYPRAFLRVLGSRNVYSASTVDQMPKQVAAGLMFGTGLSIPVPDLDRTRHLLVLGADPVESNGSLMTAPDVRARLHAIRARGGRIVVVDPRRSRTADLADEHHFIRPGTDALLLFALAQVLIAEDLVRLGRLEPHVRGLAEIARLAARFPPERVAGACGIDAPVIRRLARDLAAAPAAAVYGRIGTTTQAFGTLASWLVDVLNVLTGNRDRPGGAMFTRAAAGASNTAGEPGRGKGVRFGRRTSRVSGLPELFGELPVVCLAEEIETPGEGQVRALVTIAGNPVLSTPNGARLSAALEHLECMVSCDIYLNETTRHADVILPGSVPLERGHYDFALRQLAIRNVATYSPPVLSRPPGTPADWEIMLRLTGIVLGQGAAADVAALDDLVARQQAEAACRGLPDRDPDALLAALAPRRGPERLLDLLLRSGPYGDRFGERPGGLTLGALEQHPHGIDLGALAPRIPEVLRTPSGAIELAPPEIVADVERLERTLEARPPALVLVGRRHLRSNNSWMHNVPSLVSGRDRCTVLVHPDDAARLGLVHGAPARITSRVGTVELPVEVSDVMMPGVVSVPHGWGHGEPGTALGVAATHAGASVNRLTDEALYDPLSGTAALSGVPVTLQPGGATEAPVK
jgi:anaerobic selenocysteine-containing dehydrogenase